MNAAQVQSVRSDNRSALIECEFCGLHQADAELREGERAQCARCGSTIRFRKPASIERSLALAICGLLLFVPANAFAIMTFTVMGSENDNRLLTGVAGLLEGGAHIVGVLVLIASVLAPLARPPRHASPRLASPRVAKKLPRPRSPRCQATARDATSLQTRLPLAGPHSGGRLFGRVDRQSTTGRPPNKGQPD